jgi:hypothetical protein
MKQVVLQFPRHPLLIQYYNLLRAALVTDALGYK